MKTRLKILLTLLILVLLASGAYQINNSRENNSSSHKMNYITQSVEGDSYIFNTTEGSTGAVTYLKDKEQVIVNINGEYYKLNKAPSGSGSRYTNKEKTIEFWEHHGEAKLIVNYTEHTVPSFVETSIELFEIADEMIACTEETQDPTCLFVNGEVFQFTIEGFEYETGNTYVISVAKTIDVDGVPMYQLLEVLEKNQTVVKTDSSSDDTLSLEDTSWSWVQTEYEDGTIVTPSSEDFVATFTSEGEFTSETDCNSVFGSYDSTESELNFGMLASTKMACAGEVYEEEYTSMISSVISYEISDENELVLETTDGGVMTFTDSAK